MNTSPSAVSKIAEFEGCRLTPYNDIAGNATVGVGHLLHKGPLDGTEEPWTEEQALSSFASDLKTKAEQWINSVVKVPLSQNQFDSLSSFTYNLGSGVLRDLVSNSGLNFGNYDHVPVHLIKYNKARINGVLTPVAGLTRRREWEVGLWDS